MSMLYWGIVLLIILYVIFIEIINDKTRLFNSDFYTAQRKYISAISAYSKEIEEYKKEFMKLRIMSHHDSSEMNEMMADAHIEGDIGIYMDYKLISLRKLKDVYILGGDSTDTLEKIENGLRIMLYVLETTYNDRLEMYTTKHKIEKHKEEVRKLKNLGNDEILFLGNDVIAMIESIIKQHDNWIKGGMNLSPDPKEN